MIVLREAECCALAGTDCRPTALRRRAGRPQLKRDPLGSTGRFKWRTEGAVHTEAVLTQLLAVVVVRGDSDETAAEYVAQQLGYRIAVPRAPSLQSIARKVPDLIFIDWSPSFKKENEHLVREVRSNAVLREVPICIFYSSEG